MEEEQERNCRQSDQRLPFRGRFWVNYRRSRFRRLQGGAPRVPSASGREGRTSYNKPLGVGPLGMLMNQNEPSQTGNRRRRSDEVSETPGCGFLIRERVRCEMSVRVTLFGLENTRLQSRSGLIAISASMPPSTEYRALAAA